MFVDLVYILFYMYAIAYSDLKEIYGPTTSGTSPLLNIDGTTLITDKEDILKRWAEHFDSVLNHPQLSTMKLSINYLKYQQMRR